MVSDVAFVHGFEEYIFPRMVPDEVLAKTGWLTNHREEVWFVDPRREFNFTPDEPGWFNKQEQFPSAPYPYVLDPIQCISLYYALYNKTLQPDRLPIKAFEYQGGWSHRYESMAEGLVRGIEFLRLELVWIAQRDEADAIRTKVLDATLNALAERLELNVTIERGDSCFEEPVLLGREPGFNRDQLTRLVKQAASIDVCVPYHSEKEPLEIASAGRHDMLPKRFQIKVGSSEEAMYPWSGCLGIGLTRLAAVFLKKHGFNTNEWPKEIQRYFEDASARPI